MVRSFRHIAIAVMIPMIAIGLASCASGADVRAMSDPSANFSQYQTFGFSEPLDTDKKGYRTLISQKLVASTSREMEARGFRYEATNPQLRINFNASLDEKLRVSNTPVPVAGYGYYGYRRGFYQPWPIYADRTEVTPYNQGVLTIDVIDAARQQLVWEGTVTDAVRDSDIDKVEALLEAAVASAFAKFPVATR